MLENIRLSLRGIWSHKLRSFLTMLGVIIGIASIIAIVSIVEGTNQRLEKSLIGSGNNVVNLTLCQGDWPYDFSSGVPDNVPMVSEDTLSAIESLDNVTGVTAYHQRQGWGTVYYKDKGMSNGYVTGIQENYFHVMEYDLISGRTFKDDEYTSGKKVAIIDETAKNTLFEGENPVGAVIEIKQEPFTIVGVAKNRNAVEADYESIDDYYMNGSESRIGTVFIPFGTWPVIYQYDEPESVGVKVTETKEMQPGSKAAAEILNMNVMNGEYSYGTGTEDNYADDLKTLTNAIQMMLVGIASLSLLVGGIGVMNIMLVSVTERTSEIGLKKALGAKRRVILWQFLTESAVLTSFGGLLGIVAGIALAKGISVVTGMDFGISVPWIIISVLFSMFIGILFGAMPANQASKLNPIDALRRE